jgi:Phage integrase, N-terminal SAM-like domain
MESKTKLLDQMRHVLRLKHMSIRTEKAYVQWAKRFILFHHKRHPADMGAPEIRAFLIYLAVEGQIAASTQNVALQALVFLYRHVLKQPFPELEDLEHAKKSRRVPVVFARQEVTKVLAQLTGPSHLMASLLYGSGLRLMECVRRIGSLKTLFAPPQCIPRAPQRHPPADTPRGGVHARCALGGSSCRSAGYEDKTDECADEAEHVLASKRLTPTPR